MKKVERIISLGTCGAIKGGIGVIKHGLLIIFLVAALLTFSSMTNANAMAAEPDSTLKIEARSAILLEPITGAVLYEQEADVPLSPASVTKVMTLLLIMEEIEKGALRLDETIVISPEAAAMGGSQIWLEPGEEMKVADLIKAIAIVSANDASYALAERLSGSHDAFVARMNERARELGMKTTKFVNCTGLSEDDPSSPGNITSARDVAFMSRELIRHSEILKWTGTWIDYLRNGASFLRNTNKLVRFYQGCDGLKTGFTNEAGFCLAATAKRNNVRLIVVVMKAATNDIRAKEVSRLLNFGFGRLEAIKVVSGGEELAKLPVVRGTEDTISAAASSDYYLPNRRGVQPEISKTVNLGSKLKAPIQKGQKLGTMTVHLNGEPVQEIELLATTDVGRTNGFQFFAQVSRQSLKTLFAKD
ncbi:MAG TPA: D-alanyl-D-alanine carboxypeptidase [Firmicutes bacterium]|jgi:D-alanyl-D-alanine carboxypeptidase (penicillin-binding protein 5/6)|nr:D-alanyl-D-alanine carboxypeptidase [Bacillota bacterium]